MTDNQGDIPRNERGGGGWLPWLQERLDDLLVTLNTTRAMQDHILELTFSARPNKDIERGVLGFIETWLEATVRQDDDLLFYYPLSTGDPCVYRWFLVWKED